MQYEEIEVLDVLSAHDYGALITWQEGGCVYEAVGHISCGELVAYEDVEMVHSDGEDEYKAKRGE